MKEYSDRFYVAGEPVSVFIGATASILEALEQQVTSVHICSRPLMEAHSSQLWPALEVERLSVHVFRYRLRIKGAYIAFGDEAGMFEKYMSVTI